VATNVDLHFIHGAVKHGIWCDVHALPHGIEYAVYSYCEPASGFLNIRHVKDVKTCDLR
jgi:hypothetical protein